MASGELLHVAVKVLRAQLVERAAVRPLEQGPQALDAVGMHLTLDVFAQRVLDRVVVEREGLLSRRIVGVDGGLPVRMILDESLQRFRVGRLDDCRCDLIRRAVLRAHDRRLADRPAARVRQFLALRVAHVFPLAAQVGFVHLDRPREQLAVLRQCGTQSLSQKPG